MTSEILRLKVRLGVASTRVPLVPNSVLWLAKDLGFYQREVLARLRILVDRAEVRAVASPVQKVNAVTRSVFERKLEQLKRFTIAIFKASRYLAEGKDLWVNATARYWQKVNRADLGELLRMYKTSWAVNGQMNLIVYQETASFLYRSPSQAGRQTVLNYDERPRLLVKEVVAIRDYGEKKTRGTRTYRLADKAQAFLASLPEDSKDKTYYRDKIKAYSNECGCSMGATFLLGAVGVLAVYLCLATNWQDFHLTKGLLLALTSIIGSSICGKLIGIAVARVRLLMLYRSICKSFDSGGANHVHLY